MSYFNNTSITINDNRFGLIVSDNNRFLKFYIRKYYSEYLIATYCFNDDHVSFSDLDEFVFKDDNDVLPTVTIYPKDINKDAITAVCKEQYNIRLIKKIIE